MNFSRIARSPFLWILLGLVMIGLLIDFLGNADGFTEEPTSRVIQVIEGDEPLKEVVLIDNEQAIQVTMKDEAETKMKAVWVGDQAQQIIPRLNERVAEGSLDSWQGLNPTPGFLTTLLSTLIPFLLIGMIILFIFNSAQGGGSRVMQFGKSKAKAASKDTPKNTFGDVAGCEEAIEELQEIKEFLAEPAKFQAVGAKIPKGVLLYGPPGTGKTLLARAVAGEAGVPFYSISGSDFVEMFVGVGASRVRDLFEQAKENAPAIVFIDEIDAVGRHRGAGMGGGHDEREQTLNQLLVEMDGFDVRGGVILIAATNRPDVLDPALLRPGRFDRQIAVEAPDLAGRLQILNVHANGKPLAADVDLASVARRTPGFTGADLANVLNEAALLTARSGSQQITARDLDEAIDRVIAGPQKHSRIMDERERLITAYHEGGHALVAAAMPATDPVQKITILPRGRALGYTMVMPDEDKYSNTRGELLDQLAYMLGGRAAEELIFHDPTTGASNDIEKATKVARSMVTEYGMTERLGAIRFGAGDQEPFLGREMGGGGNRTYSEEVAGIIDEEVARLIHQAHQEAYQVLQDNRDVLDELVRQLFQHETLNKHQVEQIFAALKRHPKRPAWTGSPDREPSMIPPVTPPPVPEDQQAGGGGGALPPGGVQGPTDIPPGPLGGAGGSGPQGPQGPQGPLGPQGPATNE
ncbi:ATP-dependent zinc metalloprotease FtsH [Parenemella sanctibonifatiensis]|uniref:ATP-dependent zinc metalloprotease FtsH n=1 Tax=Parenemella sanctibonifatiensis TaxID=2016505 RepID=A0A255DZA2_9ACTN|nr:ATP-dependent zinc metalloprotease FtsH [Parenemella sanctibonifatiensis]OYN84638.1 cell division protein FtsH [Parenemella sanctibonifatiensis]